MADGSPYDYYLGLLGTWAGNPALPSQWFVVFHLNSVNCLKSNLQEFLKKKESAMGTNSWNIQNSTIKYLTDGKFQYSTDNLVGCTFAQSVSLNGESNNFESSTVTTGYKAPTVSSGRTSTNSFSVKFLETNASFVDFVIKPWSVAVGYNGLVSRKPDSPKYVKCNQVDVVLLAKTGYLSPMAFRKIYRYQNVVPISIGGESYSYDPKGLNSSNVTFSFDTYSISDHHTPSLINR